MFTGLFGFGHKGTKKGANQLATEQPEDKKIIAVMPLQKAFPSPIYLSSQPGFFTVAKRMFEEKRLKLGRAVDYDPAFVEKYLGQYLVDGLFKNGFLVFTPQQVEPYVKEWSLYAKELPLEELSEHLKANAFLLVTITEWDAENYDRDGAARVGFRAALIDAATKRQVWTNEAKQLTLKTPSKDFLYAQYQKEVLQDLARRILKGFPKKDWA